jgi:protein-S-isoprenylcysteine O-methyltransferase Ste14
MSHDEVFQIVMVTVLLVVFPIGMYHRIRSQATGEPLDRRQEGLFMLVTLRPLAAAFWLGLFAWMIDPDWMAWSSVPLPASLRWAGVGVIVAAAALMLWTFRSLGKNLTDTVVTRRQHALVVHGPYRWIRHPFYDAGALLMLAIALIASNWFLLVTGMGVFSLLVMRTRVEEQNLMTRFGSSYRTYMDQTGRFLPRMGTSPQSPTR